MRLQITVVEGETGLALHVGPADLRYPLIWEPLPYIVGFGVGRCWPAVGLLELNPTTHAYVTAPELEWPRERHKTWTPLICELASLPWSNGECRKTSTLLGTMSGGKSMDEKIDGVGKKVDKVFDNLSRVMWVVLSGVVLGIVGFMMKRGFA